MTIVHIIFSLDIGGAENLLVDLANQQVEVDDISLIVVNNDINKHLLARLDDRVERLFLHREKSSKTSFYFLVRLWHYLIKKKPDVIHCHDQRIIPLLALFKSKTIITVHDVKLKTRNLQQVQKIFVVSKAVYNDLRKSNFDSIVVYNGINFGSYKKRQDYTLSANTFFNIVQVSRLEHQKKGQDILLHALHQLVLHYNFNNINIDFVGDGPSEKHLRLLADKLKLNDRVHFVGSKDRLWIQQNIAKYHLLIQPSRYEGFGLTILEGIASGIPVIASNIDGPAEILANIPSGILFNTTETKDLAEKIMLMISLYKRDHIKDVCRESYIKARAQFSLEETCNNYKKHYSNMQSN